MGNPLNVIMIDNYDSFTYNLVDQFRLIGAKVIVFRNSTPLEEIFSEERINSKNTLIVISPGPGNPDSAGNSLEIIARFSGKLPILGICLGHQSIIQYFGGKIEQAKQIVHGKADDITVQPIPSNSIDSTTDKIFSGLGTSFRAARYHSLVATEVPENLTVIAHCKNEPMAVRHQQHKLLGFQFHPESILTTQGSRLLKNSITWLMETTIDETG